MEAMMIWTARAQRPTLTVDRERRALVVDLYRARLTRVLQLVPGTTATLTLDEQHLLQTRATVATVGVLSALGEGELASDLLRQAGQGL